MILDTTSMNGSSDERQRELMRPWLIRQIEEGGIEGLVWLDDAHTMVKIPWTHGSRQGFDDAKDACLFERWARHTSR